MSCTPSLPEVTSALLGDAASGSKPQGNIIPVFRSLPADLLTPVIAYLRMTDGAEKGRHGFLCESVTGGEKIGRYSFVGSDPYKVLRTGDKFELQGDPLTHIKNELQQYRYIPLAKLPRFTGGGMGYIAYDCVHYFEPRTARQLKDPLGIPESVYMFCDTILVFDRIFQSIKCVSHVYLPDDAPQTAAEVERRYQLAVGKVEALAQKVLSPNTPLPKQEPIVLGHKSVSNVGKEGYEGFVTSLKKNIVRGDIIQAVPSQRLARKTSLHPFNIYRHLRQINPSPYMYYVDCGAEDCQIIGASPETLCKIEDGKVAVHAIAGTVKRGETDEEDLALGTQLQESPKDRAEHVMLVDLARNDISRVCDPITTKVETFMQLEKFSHVIHLTSRITGQLREGKDRFDALRSIFPAGTVSGAPKIRAIELVSELEGEKRGIYAGAVGHIDFADREMDVAIAIRTMTYKDGVVYMQAGGGIVFDSVEEEEFIETINKLGANVRCIDQAEAYHHEEQQRQAA